MSSTMTKKSETECEMKKFLQNNQNRSVQLKKSLIKTRNAIKKKFRDLHNQKLAISVRANEEYKPIIDPLKILVAETKKQQKQSDESKLQYDQLKNLKNEKLMGGVGTNRSVYKTALPPHRRVLFDTPSTSKAAALSTSSSARRPADKHNISGVSQLHWIDDENDDQSFHEKNQNEVEFTENLLASEDSDSVEQKLIREVNSLKSPQIDLMYGLRSHKGHLKLGNDKVTIGDDKNGVNYTYNIRTKKFAVTPGLTSLLLENNPKYYTETDLKRYQDMLLYTNAHKKDFSTRGAIRRHTKSTKYNKIITQLFPDKRKKSGAGITKMRKPQMDYKIVTKNAKVNYTYWDDPNELVDRLRLLLASTSAGHTGHNNEIISIIEELHEAKMIV